MKQEHHTLGKVVDVAAEGGAAEGATTAEGAAADAGTVAAAEADSSAPVEVGGEPPAAADGGAVPSESPE